MTDRDTQVPLATEIISGIGGLFLVVGIVMLGFSYLDRGTWGSFSDAPARVTTVGILILFGVGIIHAVRRDVSRRR